MGIRIHLAEKKKQTSGRGESSLCVCVSFSDVIVGIVMRQCILMFGFFVGVFFFIFFHFFFHEEDLRISVAAFLWLISVVDWAPALTGCDGSHDRARQHKAQELAICPSTSNHACGMCVHSEEPSRCYRYPGTYAVLWAIPCTQISTPG